MEAPTTPTGERRRLKPVGVLPWVVGVEGLDPGRLDRLLRVARGVSGLAAYHYFFRSSTAESRAAYLAALAAETEAELLLRDLCAV